VYGIVPPDGVAVNVIDWLMSIVGLEGVMAPADRAELIVTALSAEQSEVDKEAESVTLYE
jgi:hypothetical protein